MDVNSVSGTIDAGMNYVHIFTSGTRDLITKILSYIPNFDGRLGLIILTFILSIFLAKLIAKRYVVKPFSGTYFVWTSVLTLMWFIILTYI